MKAPSFHVRAKINNVFWCYISFTKNGAPGARYVNPIENALTPSGRSERARAKALLEPRLGVVGAPLARGPARGSRGVQVCVPSFLYIVVHIYALKYFPNPIFSGLR